MASGHSPSSQPTCIGRERGKREREKLITASILVVTGVAVAAGLFSAVALLEEREVGRSATVHPNCSRGSAPLMSVIPLKHRRCGTQECGTQTGAAAAGNES